MAMEQFDCFLGQSTEWVHASVDSLLLPNHAFCQGVMHFSQLWAFAPLASRKKQPKSHLKQVYAPKNVGAAWLTSPQVVIVGKRSLRTTPRTTACQHMQLSSSDTNHQEELEPVY